MRLSRGRFTLTLALIEIAFVAIYFAQIRQVLGFAQPVSTIVLEALDGEEKSLADALISPAVLDDALNRAVWPGSLSRLPRFAGTTNPRAELRRLLVAETDPRSHTVRLSIPHGESDEILMSLSVSARLCWVRIELHFVAFSSRTDRGRHSSLYFLCC